MPQGEGYNSGGYTSTGNPAVQPKNDKTSTPAKGTGTGTPKPAGPTLTPEQKAAQGLQKTADQIRNEATGPASIFDNPQAFLEGMSLSDRIPTMNPNAPGTNLNGNKYQGDADEFSVDPVTGKVTNAAGVKPKDAQGYEVDTTFDKVMKDGQATAQQGQLSDGSIVNAEQLDTQGAATGVNADGSINHTGKALQDYAKQGMSSVIDTSTVAGKLLAAELGEGNYVDAKATMTGQLELLSKQFVGANGEPVIPSWASGTARNVARIAAFTGMTGTAGTAAMAQAIMEASLPIAQQDSAFYQTLTVTNLNNKQQQILQRADVLAKFDMANLDARTAAAVQNAQAFLAMDMKNLDNRQQTEMVNTQARIQSIMEDSKAKNAERMFQAESQNDFTKFYDQLGSQISMFNAEQKNAMEKFNAGEINDSRQFNAQLESGRDQFYAEMQYNVDLANARWRQTVATTNTAMKFEAAQTDVQNMFNISQESLNRLWDREDAMLDYAWKTVQNEEDREVQMYGIDMQMKIAKYQNKQENKRAIGKAIFNIGAKLFGL